MNKRLLPEPVRPVTPARIAAALCMLPPLVFGPWVSLYNRLTPRLAGVPFFYWSQLLWVVVTAALTATALFLLRNDLHRVRRARADI